MKKVYVTWQISRKIKCPFWRGHMEVSSPYDWDTDDGGIPWMYAFDFIGLTQDKVFKKVNGKLYEIQRHTEYPVQLVFPSSTFENTDWA